MKPGRRVALFVVAVMIGPTAAFDASSNITCKEPLSATPGWTYIPQRTVDSWTGAYHDANSGALLVFDVAPAGTLAADRLESSGERGDAMRAVLDGLNYEVRRIKNIGEHLRRKGGAGNRASSQSGHYPGVSATRLSVVFHGRDRTWMFTSDIYSAAQEARVRDLLIGDVLRLCEAPVKGFEPEYDSAVSSSAYEALKAGATLMDILAALGRPLGVEALPPEGLALWYLVQSEGGAFRHAKLCFDHQQRLTSRKIVR